MSSPRTKRELNFGKAYFADKNFRLTSLHTGYEQACLPMVVPLTRRAFAEKQPDLFVIFSTSSEKVLFSFFLDKTTKRYSFRNIFAKLSIIVRLQKRQLVFEETIITFPKSNESNI